MGERFIVSRGDKAHYTPVGALAPGAHGLSRWNPVSEAAGAAHTDFGISRLEPGGLVPAHVHSFEESFHLLEGSVTLVTPEATVELVAGDYGVIPIGVPHSWRATGEGRAVWSDIMTPPPRERHGFDTFPVAELPEAQPMRGDARDPRTRSFGAIDAAQLDPARQSQELLAQSASMRTALLVYSGISLKMMVDSDLGSVLSTMFMVQYEATGVAGPHDHPLEEAYLITDGEVDATFDGEQFRLRPGDIAWAAVGCVHSFAAVGEPVRWLETQAPQMPPRHAYRFARDWAYLADKLAAEG
jgi:quercetin dioxygenase-like cupin family protein